MMEDGHNDMSRALWLKLPSVWKTFSAQRQTGIAPIPPDPKVDNPMDLKESLVELINAPERITTLATTGPDGAANTAIIGSAFMPEKDQLWIGLGDNRTAKNLRTNLQGVLLVFKPGKTVLDWEGGRLYFKIITVETEGDRFDQMVERVKTTAGRFAARTIRQMAICRICEVRPLAELGKEERGPKP